jgi:hypothetical protein
MEEIKEEPKTQEHPRSDTIGMFLPYINMALEMRNDMKERYDERLKEILKKWDDSRHLPRKAKKRMRKELQLDFSILEYGKDLFMF